MEEHTIHPKSSDILDTVIVGASLLTPGPFLAEFLWHARAFLVISFPRFAELQGYGHTLTESSEGQINEQRFEAGRRVRILSSVLAGCVAMFLTPSFASRELQIDNIMDTVNPSPGPFVTNSKCGPFSLPMLHSSLSNVFQLWERHWKLPHVV